MVFVLSSPRTLFEYHKFTNISFPEKPEPFRYIRVHCPRPAADSRAALESVSVLSETKVHLFTPQI